MQRTPNPPYAGALPALRAIIGFEAKGPQGEPDFIWSDGLDGSQKPLKQLHAKVRGCEVLSVPEASISLLAVLLLHHLLLAGRRSLQTGLISPSPPCDSESRNFFILAVV